MREVPLEEVIPPTSPRQMKVPKRGWLNDEKMIGCREFGANNSCRDDAESDISTRERSFFFLSRARSPDFSVPSTVTGTDREKSEVDDGEVKAEEDATEESDYLEDCKVDVRNYPTTDTRDRTGPVIVPISGYTYRHTYISPLLQGAAHLSRRQPKPQIIKRIPLIVIQSKSSDTKCMLATRGWKDNE